MKLHKSLTIAKLMRAARADDGAGYCVTCGKRRDGWTESDVEAYPCEYCHTPTVVGAEQLLLMIVP
jgi:hypothetical protein